ncbi:MAG: FixH family protein [Pseudomonadota bacterium]
MTLVTLFGGLVGVLVLYGLGGLVRSMPLMLRAALAGLIPLAAYFILTIGRWPGLDVAAIHISVFLAAALVLFASSQLRRRGGRMHWVPKLLISFFVGLAVLNGILLYIATSGLPEPLGRWWLGGDGGRVYSGFSGVVAHGRGAAKAVSSELSEAHREGLLGWQVETKGLDATGTTLPIRIRVRDRTGLPVGDAQAVLEVRRPGALVPERTLTLARTESGVYQGALVLPAGGRWLVEIRLRQNAAVRYHSTHEVNLP